MRLEVHGSVAWLSDDDLDATYGPLPGGELGASWAMGRRSRLVDRLREQLPEVTLYYAIKAFPHLEVLRSLQSLYDHGRLGGTGYVSILPVDQGIEHSAAASFAPNPAYFDPKNIVELAIEGGCNGVASTFGVLAMVSRRYAHKIPFLVGPDFRRGDSPGRNPAIAGGNGTIYGLVRIGFE